MATIVPVARSLVLCEESDTEGGLTNLYGVFYSLERVRFPHREAEFVAFAQLAGGLGQVPFYLDIRRASDDRLVHTTELQTLTFADRVQVVQVAVRLLGIVFPTTGVYTVELFCDNTWVADVAVTLLEEKS